MAEIITSASNQKIKRIVALQKKARERRREGKFVMEGERLFTDTPRDFLREVYVTEEFVQRADAKLLDLPYSIVTKEIMAKISDTNTPQGVICVADMPSYGAEDALGDQSAQEAPLILALENIQDPGNLGTMFRTAEAAGVSGILMSSDTVDLFNPKAVRATMSAIFRMPFLVADDFRGTLRELRTKNYSIAAAHLDGRKFYDEISFTGSSVILIGNEGNGLTQETAEIATDKILIPMRGKIESLNAAMAAGILMYEASAQRRRRK